MLCDAREQDLLAHAQSPSLQAEHQARNHKWKGMASRNELGGGTGPAGRRELPEGGSTRDMKRIWAGRRARWTHGQRAPKAKDGPAGQVTAD